MLFGLTIVVQLQMYGFEGEVKAKYDHVVMELFTELFNDLPLCAVINKKVFVTHGGLFCNDGVKLKDIAAIPRGREPPDSGTDCIDECCVEC